LPGVNWDHAALLDVPRRKRGWKGFISPGPNCTTVGLAMTLRPLDIAFGIERVLMTSMQALSGAGRSPGYLDHNNARENRDFYHCIETPRSPNRGSPITPTTTSSP
jgi:aspartate-semialdehyde dehydrogenase